MSILSGFKKFKDYILTENGYQLSSRWTKSDAVVMGDGTDDTNTLEKNLGSIQGITDSITATSSNIALSAKGANDMYHELNSNLNVISVVYETTVSASDVMQVSIGGLIDITDGKITPDTFCGAVAYYGGYVSRNYLSTNGNLYVIFDSNMTFTNIPMRFTIFGKI